MIEFNNKRYIERFKNPASMHILFIWIDNNVCDPTHKRACDCMNCDAEKFEFWREFANNAYASGIRINKNNKEGK